MSDVTLEPQLTDDYGSCSMKIKIITCIDSFGVFCTRCALGYCQHQLSERCPKEISFKDYPLPISLRKVLFGHQLKLENGVFSRGCHQMHFNSIVGSHFPLQKWDPKTDNHFTIFPSLS